MPLKIYQKNEKGSLSRINCILAIAAGKGGVGKSTVTINLALALQRKGYQVGVMDADIYGPSLRKMLPEDKLPIKEGDILYPALCQGIKMISMAYFRKEQEAAVVRAPIANSIINQFVKNVDWGTLDYLLIDFPPGTGDVQLTLSQQVRLTGAIMVTTPQAVATLDVRKAIHMFDQVNIPLIGVVENMSYYYHPATKETLYLFGKGGGELLAKEVNAPFLGQIPLDPAVCFCSDNGRSIFVEETAQGSPSITAFELLANQVTTRTAELKEEGNHASFELNWKEMEER